MIYSIGLDETSSTQIDDYEAINAVSRMTGKQKMLLDTHKELIEDLKEKVEDND